MTFLEKVAAFFGLPETATQKEVDAKVDQELTAKAAATSTEDKGEDAGAKEAGKADAATPAADAPAANEQAAAPTLTIEAVEKLLTAALAPIGQRLTAIETADAAPPAGGKTEVPEVKEEDPALYTQNPINQRIAARLAGKK